MYGHAEVHLLLCTRNYMTLCYKELIISLSDKTATGGLDLASKKVIKIMQEVLSHC